jgi:hypothetical protein
MVWAARMHVACTLANQQLGLCCGEGVRACVHCKGSGQLSVAGLLVFIFFAFVENAAWKTLAVLE